MRFRSFFYAFLEYRKIRVEVERCVQELHWHAQSANSAIITRRRIRKHILTEWKSRNTADSAELTQFTRKPNNFRIKRRDDGRFSGKDKEAELL